MKMMFEVPDIIDDEEFERDRLVLSDEARAFQPLRGNLCHNMQQVSVVELPKMNQIVP